MVSGTKVTLLIWNFSVLPFERQVLGLTNFMTNHASFAPHWFNQNNSQQMDNGQPYPPLNDDQSRAVRCALSRPMTVIQGQVQFPSIHNAMN